MTGEGILLVDDSPLQRAALTGLVEDAGFADVRAVASAEQALALLAASTPGSIGVILMDLDMPGVDGIEACRRIRELPGWSDTPVIMVTSSDAKEHLRQAFAAGAIDYVTKPPDEVELVARMHSALALKHEMERRKQRERELVRSEGRLANVLASAIDAIITLGAGRRITLFNPAAEQIFRLGAPAALGMPLERLMAEGSRAVLLAWLDQAVGRASERLWAPEGLYGRRADGEEFPLEMTVSPSSLDDSHQYTVILRDISERDKAATALHSLRARHQSLQEVLQREQQIEGFVGSSPVMQPVLDAVERVAQSDTTVLITGETGTGKELIARAIHAASPRGMQPLVPVNCAALPGDLIESELFGHERGAFTGASVLRKGRFELADGGSIFLDEIGEMPLPAQAKLLRALQEQQFERVGGTQTLKVNVRVVAATNRDLREMVAQGQFRADLYYRLNVFPIQVPPLRERVEDIRPLTEFFLERCSRKLGKRISGILPASLERLMRYRWPGNIRELQNVIERAVILSSHAQLEIPELQPGCVAEEPAASAAVDDVMRQHIQRVLEQHRWIIEGRRGAATALGMRPSTLRYRMKQLGIRRYA